MGRAYSIHKEIINGYKIVVWKSQWEGPFGRPSHRSEDIKMDCRETWNEPDDWIWMAEGWHL